MFECAEPKIYVAAESFANCLNRVIYYPLRNALSLILFSGSGANKLDY